MCEVSLKLTQKGNRTNHRRRSNAFWRRSGVCIVDFKQIPQFALVFLLLNLRKSMPTGVDLNQKIFPKFRPIRWEWIKKQPQIRYGYLQRMSAKLQKVLGA